MKSVLSESDKKFRESLELGIAAENSVYSYLVRTYEYVHDLRQQKHGEFAGPALIGQFKKVVLPDFVVYKDDSSEAFAIDVKAKKSLYPFNGKLCFTVDKKFEDYKKSAKIMRLDYLAIIFLHNKQMFQYRDTDCIGSQYINNSYGNGLVYYFEYDMKRVIV